MEIRSLDNGTEYYVDASGQFAGLVGDSSASAVNTEAASAIISSLGGEDLLRLSVGLDVEGVDMSMPGMSEVVSGISSQDALDALKVETAVADLSPQDLMSLSVGLDVEGVDMSNPLVMGLLDQDGDGRFTSQEVLDRVSSNPVAVAELEAAPVTETVVLNKPEGSGNYTVEDAFGNVRSIDRKDFTDFKRENDRKLAMLAGTYEPRDADDRREMKAVQERAEKGESAYAKEVRASESDGPYYGVAVGDASSDAGTIKQDDSGNWYTVVKNPNSNTVGRDYSIDPQDNSQGPTFGGNVSDYVAETFSDEVAAAGGSTEEPEFIGFTQLLENIVTGKTTDVPSVGFDAGTGTFETGAAAAVTEQTFDEAFAANRAAGNDTFEWNGGVYTTDLASAVDTTPFIPTGGPGTFGPGALPAAEVESVISTGGPGTFVPGSLPAAEYSSLTVGDPLTPQLALELGLSDIYQEGDTLLPQDLVALDDLGFDVDQGALSGIDLKTGADAGTITVDTVGGANNVTDALLNLTGAMGAGNIGADEALATLNLIEGNDLTDADVAALLPPKVETTASDVTGTESVFLDAARKTAGVYLPGMLTGIGQGLQGVDIQKDQALRAIDNALADETYTENQYSTSFGEAGRESGAFLDDPETTKMKNFGSYQQGVIGKAGEFVSGLGDKLQSKILTPREIAEKNTSAILGTLPQDLEIAGTTLGTALQLGQEVGEEFVDLAVMMVTRNPLILGSVGVLGAGEATEAAKQQADGAIQTLYDEGKLQDNPTYLKAVGILGEQGALDYLANEVLASSILEVSATGATDAAIKGKIGKALGEGAQEVAESAFVSNAVNDVLNLTGDDKLNIFQDASGNFVTGALAGAGAAVTTDAIETAKNIATYNNAVGSGYDDLGGLLTTVGGSTKTSTQGKFFDTLGNEFDTAAEASASDLALGVGGPGTFVPGALPAASDDANLTARGGDPLGGPTASEKLLGGDPLGGPTASEKLLGTVDPTEDPTEDPLGGPTASEKLLGGTDVTKQASVNDLSSIPSQVLVGDSLSGVSVADSSGQDFNFDPREALDIRGSGATRVLFGENQKAPVDMDNLDYGTPVYKTVKNTDGSQSIIVGSRISGGSDSGRDNYVTAAVVIPDNASPEQMNEAITVAYDNWKSNYSGVTTSDDITANKATVLENTNITTFNPFDSTDVTDKNVDLGFEGLSDADTTDAESSLEGKTTIVTDGVTTQKGTGGTGGTGGIGGTGGTGTIATGVTGTGDATKDANTTITANNDATVTTSNDGNVTITTATDSQGNAVVTTKNNVTGETTTDNVAVNNTAVVTNSGVTVNVNAAVDGTTTTMVDPTVDPTVEATSTPQATGQEAAVDAKYVIEYDDIVDGADQPQTLVAQPQTLVAQPQPAVAAPTSYTPPDSDGDPTTDPVGETQPGYTSGIADLGAGGRMRPVVAPYYQPQQTGLYSFYRPQPGVDQTPAAPVFNEPTSYLSPTGGLRYGNPYIGTNLSLAQLRELAELQGTGAALLPSEDLMNGS